MRATCVRAIPARHHNELADDVCPGESSSDFCSTLSPIAFADCPAPEIGLPKRVYHHVKEIPDLSARMTPRQRKVACADP
jgi:hypothetical protein